MRHEVGFGKVSMVGDMLLSEVEHWLDALYIAVEGAGLRREDRRKAIEVRAVLAEIQAAVRRCTRRQPLVLVDAAAGKSYVGVLAAKLVLEPQPREARVVTIERDAGREPQPREARVVTIAGDVGREPQPREARVVTIERDVGREPQPREARVVTIERDVGRVAQSRRAVERVQTAVPIDCRVADVANPGAWPEAPSIVVALHACGAAADVIIDRAIATGAHHLLLVPCCTSRAVAAAVRAEERAGRDGIPHHAPVRRRYIQALVDADRTWRLEAAGYETEVVEFVGATVTPHNLLWRARRVGEPTRMAKAARGLDALGRERGPHR